MDAKAERLVALLTDRGLTITTAESCTGGRMAAAITAIPGSSAVFPGGLVTYCDAVKHRVLGVPQELLDTYGAVSEPVARAMAERAAKVMETDLALSATGYAGPGTDDTAIPCGTVYLGLYAGGKTVCEHHVFPGDRAAVQRQAAARALEMALSVVSERSETHWRKP